MIIRHKAIIFTKRARRQAHPGMGAERPTTRRFASLPAATAAPKGSPQAQGTGGPLRRETTSQLQTHLMPLNH